MTQTKRPPTNPERFKFDAVRVNAQNYREEFFRVSIEALEDAASAAPGAPVFRDVEAQEYRETLAKRRPCSNPRPTSHPSPCSRLSDQL